MAELVKMKLGWLGLGLGLLSACASMSAAVPARLASIDPTTMDKIANTLRQATSVRNLTLGPQAPEATTITVLPPPLGPYETHSVAVPEIYDIKKRNGVCTLVRRSTGVAVALADVACVQVDTS
jgi:hypothetical protein